MFAYNRIKNIPTKSLSHNKNIAKYGSVNMNRKGDQNIFFDLTSL
jgi:hypothetical protein